MITVFTDGASRGNPGPGGWGAIIIYDKQSSGSLSEVQWVKEIGGKDEHTTNNRMELTAVIESLKFILERLISDIQPRIVFYLDSEYVLKGITEWIKKWQAKGWKTANKKPVLNQDLWQKLLALSDGRVIEWNHIAGHSGHELNDRCDKIATSFADGFTPELYDGPRSTYYR